VIHDRDPALLELVEPSAEVRLSDITQLTPADLVGASLVTASALLDLLTRDELVRVLDACAGLPMLFALSVTGRVTLSPADPLDARIGAAFNAHQRRGGRLGPDAVAAVVEEVGGEVRPSPWHLDDPDLIGEWFAGWVAAACEQDPGLDVGSYRERRLRSVTVEHADVLVLP
jgi:hypothetical protein